MTLTNVTAAHAFCRTSGDQALFTVPEGIPIVDALIQSSEYLRGAMAANAELGENLPMAMNALGRMVTHSIEMAQALVEASISGLEHPVGEGGHKMDWDERAVIEPCV